jgi:hypothetical protein
MAGLGGASVDSSVGKAGAEQVNTDAHTIQISGDTLVGEPARVTLEMQHRQYPECRDYWDGNWVITRFQATAPGFHADFNETVHLREILALREKLAEMHATLQGRVEWKAMDGFLELVAEMDRSGHIRWTFDLHYPAGAGVVLSLQINNDQTYLPPIMGQMDDVLEAFSIVGSVTRGNNDLDSAACVEVVEHDP